MNIVVKRIIRKVRREQVNKARDRLARLREANQEFIAGLLPGDRVSIRGMDLEFYVYNVVVEAIGNPVMAGESEYFLDLVPVDVDINDDHDYVLRVGHMDSLASRVSLVSTRE